MRRLFSILALTAIFFDASASSQSQSPTGSSSPSKPNEPKPEIKVTSRLVIVDVVVRKGNRPVPGLGQQDFAIYEDGKQQSIHDFTAHFTAQTDLATTPAAQQPTLPPNTYTNLPAPVVGASATVLLLDGLNTEPSDLQYVRREMISYLKKAPASASPCSPSATNCACCRALRQTPAACFPLSKKPAPLRPNRCLRTMHLKTGLRL